MCEAKLRAQRAQDAAQVFENLLEATRRIHAYGWARRDNAEATRTRAPRSPRPNRTLPVCRSGPRAAAAALKDAWAKAEAACGADLAANETALRLLCIRAEIATEQPTPTEDQERRRNYQLQRLVQGMGQGQEPTVFDWEALVREWVGVGPVSPAIHATLLSRFRRCRT